jgi:ribonuclease R
MSALSKPEILDFIQSSSKPVTKREIARGFGIKGGALRVALKQILKQLESEGLILKQPGGAYSIPDGLPAVSVLEVCDIDVDGDVLARPPNWDEALQGPPPRIEIMPGKKGHPALKIGDRVLARLLRTDDLYEARVIKSLDTAQGNILGRVRIRKGQAVLQPANKKEKHDFEISDMDLNGAEDGDLVLAEIQNTRGIRAKKVRVKTILGASGTPGTISLISLHEAGLSETFPDAVTKETTNLQAPSVKNREDLRAFPLVTIDGEDARDFDDAVFAEKDGENFHLIVAIADVAHYVRSGSALDREAQKRGNSTYFPDRVIPMLPEALSNDLCSLRPNEDRACLAVHMWIDNTGQLLKHKFVRGQMRSQARLTYEQVQAIHDGHTPSSYEKHKELQKIIAPLYEAFSILDKARQKRGALDLDLPERRIVLDDKGLMNGIERRVRLDAHKLIEEFMILANVCAALGIESKKDPKRFPCVYRVHEPPSADKLDSARTFLESFSLNLPKGSGIKPVQMNKLLHEASALPYAHLVHTVILRTQSQARYDPDNEGHFGLALKSYAHFTSPIRRYADLLVHRALIAAFNLGDGGINTEEITQLEEICENISKCERISMEAERNAVDRFTSAFLSEHTGATFTGRISGVTRFGLFVELDETGADGIVPMRTLPNDYYIHDENAHALIGRTHGRIYRLGAVVTVKLVEANALTGSTVFKLSGHDKGADIPGMPLKTNPERGKHHKRKNPRQNKYRRSKRKLS